MKKSRESIITGMCLTWDHAFLAPVQEVFPGVYLGLTDADRKVLWDRMAQVFDNDIAPYMLFKK